MLEILIDTHEQYPWTSTHQQATTGRRALPARDYAVTVDDQIVAAAERKSLADLVATLRSGKLKFLLADPSTVPRAALVVEDRWSQVFKLDRVRPAVVAAGIAECQVRYPMVPILFCETRPLAQEWEYRFFGARRRAPPTRRRRRNVWKQTFRAPRRLRRPNLRVPWCEDGPQPKGCLCRIGDRLRPEVWAAYRTAH